MRIVILANSDVGLVRFRKELVEMLCKEHELYIVLPRGELIEQLEALGGKFIPFEFNRRGLSPTVDLAQFRRYMALLKKLKPDVVLTYTIKPNIYGGMACQLRRIPYIANITGLGSAIENGGLLRLFSVALYKVGLRKASCVFFQNSSNLRLFVDGGIVRRRTRLVPGSGVNLAAHVPVPYPDDEGTRFLFVGRVMKEKGIEELLCAIRQLHKIRDDTTLDVVGPCEEDYMARLQDAMSEGAIRYHGMQADVRPFYAACHCVVLPSYHEGMANVILEASATARVVIASRVPGCQEAFDEGVTGFGCEARDAESLRQAMQRFIDLPRSAREGMGLAARQKIEREFDRNIVLNAYREEIENAFASVGN